MRPITFKYANRTLGAPEGEYPEDVAGIDPLPVWTNGRQCVSCWKMSWRERLAALVFGRVWLAVLSGSTQPAVGITATRAYLKEDGPPAGRCYLRGRTLLGIFNTGEGH